MKPIKRLDWIHCNVLEVGSVGLTWLVTPWLVKGILIDIYRLIFTHRGFSRIKHGFICVWFIDLYDGLFHNMLMLCKFHIMLFSKVWCFENGESYRVGVLWIVVQDRCSFGKQNFMSRCIMHHYKIPGKLPFVFSSWLRLC